MSIRIEFSNDNKRYFAGQRVSGEVEVDNHKKRKISKICINFKGVTLVNFVKNGISYRNQKVHFNITETLMGTRYKMLRPNMSRGILILPFSFKLAENIPNSNVGTYGHSKYTVSARIYSRNWDAEKIREEEFIVLHLVDLNHISNADSPLFLFDTRLNKETGQSGFISAKLNAMQSGYVPGQIIPFVIEAVNETGKDVIETMLQLKKRTKYTALKPNKETKVVDDVIKYVCIGPMKNHESKISQISMQIPSLPPSGLSLCDLIDIEYWITLLFKMPTNEDDFSLSEQVVIGNLPMSKVEAALQGFRFM